MLSSLNQSISTELSQNIALILKESEKSEIQEAKIIELLTTRLETLPPDEYIEFSPSMPTEKNSDILSLICQNGWDKLLITLISAYKSSPSKFNLAPLVNPTLWELAKGNDKITRLLNTHFTIEKTSILPLQQKIAITDVTEDFLIEETSGLDRIIYAFEQPSQKSVMMLLKEIFPLSLMKGSDQVPVPNPIYGAAQGGGAKGAAYIGAIKGMEMTGDLERLKGVAGASAGAINAFMIAMGLSADQIEKLSDKISFADFQDVVSSPLGIGLGGTAPVKFSKLISQGYVHKGLNFFNWAQCLLEHVAGDPHITFAEFKQKCAENPTLKEIIFKGFSYNGKFGKNQEVTFSAEDTPNLLVIDALRSSMAFPGAFAPWEIREKLPSGELETVGIVADGGIACNFPIEAFNQKKYEDKNYKRLETTFGSTKTKITRNPCTVGFTLCSLQELDPEITPFTERLTKLRQKRSIVDKPQKKDVPVDAQEAKKWSHLNIFSAIWTHKVGNAVKEEIEEKYKVYNQQTVQIYTEEVGTLEFALSSEKQRKIELSGYNAWMQWCKKFQNPSLLYQEKSHFKIKIPADPKEQEDYLYHFFFSHFSALLEESLSKRNHPFVEFRTPETNQRIKFHSYMIQQAIKKCQQLKVPQEILQRTLEEAHTAVVLKNKTDMEARANARVHLDEFISEEATIQRLRQLILSNRPEDHQKALRLFQGQLSGLFSLMLNSHGELLCLATHSGDKALLQGMLGTLSELWEMFYQQGRQPPFSLFNTINHSDYGSLYKYAFENDNAFELIEVLITANVDPLITDIHGKNALHYAIDKINTDGQNSVKLLEHLVAAIENEQDFAISSMKFGENGDTIGHYIIQRANKATLIALRSHPLLLEKLISPHTKNNDHVSCQELAAYHSPVLQDEEKLGEHISASTKALPQQNDIEMAQLRNECAMIHLEKKPKNAKEMASYVKEKSKQYQSSVIFMRMYREKLHESITSGDKKTLQIIIKKLTPEQCLLILGSSNILYPDKTPSQDFIFESAECTDPLIQETCADVIEVLCRSIQKSENEELYAEMLDVLYAKHDQQSPLYCAAIANNVPLLRVLRGFDASVNHAGPLNNPNALTAAAQCGAYEAITSLIQSKPWGGFLSGFRTIETGKGTDATGKNLFHHLAMSNGDPERIATAFFNALYTGTAAVKIVDVKSSLHSQTDIIDKNEHSCLYYLLKNPQAKEILEILLKKGKGYSSATTWYVDTFFDLKTKRANGYTDLEWAYKTHPELAKYLAANLWDPSIAIKAQKAIDKENALNDVENKVTEKGETGELAERKPSLSNYYNSKKDELVPPEPLQSQQQEKAQDPKMKSPKGSKFS